jgi:hypothetical protein
MVFWACPSGGGGVACNDSDIKLRYPNGNENILGEGGRDDGNDKNNDDRRNKDDGMLTSMPTMTTTRRTIGAIALSMAIMWAYLCRNCCKLLSN